MGQATAELSCEDEFTVRDSSGKTTTMPKGKYFIHAQQGKLFFDDNNVRLSIDRVQLRTS